MKRLLLLLFVALGLELGAPHVGWAGDNAFQRKEPKGAHGTGKRESTRNKHEGANARRAREQAAAAERAAKVKRKAALRRQGSTKEKRGQVAKKQGDRGTSRGRH
jgi:hypothetical protein